MRVEAVRSMFTDLCRLAEKERFKTTNLYDYYHLSSACSFKLIAIAVVLVAWSFGVSIALGLSEAESIGAIV